MIKRLFVLVFFITIGIVLSQYIDISSSWQKAQAFLEPEREEVGLLGEFLEKTKVGELEQRQVYLEKKLQKLKTDLSQTAGEGSRRFNKIEGSVMKTANALKETKQSLEYLQQSVQVSVDIIENFGEEEASEISDSRWIRIPNSKTEIEKFCKQFEL
jgi:hypothetical protein